MKLKRNALIVLVLGLVIAISGFVMDVFSGVVYLPAFFFVFAYLSEIVI